MKKSKGFTLVELMVVIVIIGILAALAIPRFMGATNKSKATEFKPQLKSIYTLQTAYRQERDKYADSLSAIAFDQPDTTAARFTYASSVTNATPTGGYLATATVKNGGKIKDINGAALDGAKAYVDTTSKQTADAKLAALSNVDPK